VKPILLKIAAQVDGPTGGPCVAYLGSFPFLFSVLVSMIGKGGAGNYVKMVHNGIEYGDMQLIAEAYDLLKNVGGLTNAEICAVFEEYNKVCSIFCCVLNIV
jgi:6-phosphogluconate dehydrogenase